MPLTVNGQTVTEELIRQESHRLAQDPRWNGIADAVERARLLRQAAEFSAVHQILVEQTAASDRRPMDTSLIERELERMKAAGGCRPAFDDTLLRRQIEWGLRLERVKSDLVAGATKASEAEVEDFYRANRENFRSQDMFHAAHIVLHVNEQQSEEQARGRIEAALCELEQGAEFSAVAERYSDCKGNGGDLGRFAAGFMVDEFERAIRDLDPGQRTGIFTTPFGFHIAELRSKTTGGPASFEEVSEDIERVLNTMAEHREYLRRIEELRARADIRRIPEPDAQAARAGKAI